MNKRVTLTLIFSTLLMILSCNDKKEEKEETVVYPTTSPVKMDTVINKEFVSQIRSERNIEIRAQEKGFLEKIYVDEGQHVQAGQVLFRIMPQLYQADVLKAKAEVAQAAELAVKKFEAELAKSNASEYDLKQQITEKENQINALLGRYPQPIVRTKESFMSIIPQTVYTGIPSQLLANRPDIKQAELELQSAKLDVEAARKEFYPSLDQCSFRIGSVQTFLSRETSRIYGLQFGWRIGWSAD